MRLLLALLLLALLLGAWVPIRVVMLRLIYRVGDGC
jgi:hypothetical protein